MMKLDKNLIESKWEDDSQGNRCLNFYNEDFCDYVRLQEILDEKSALEAQLEEKTERWMYLTELAEKIEAQKK